MKTYWKFAAGFFSLLMLPSMSGLKADDVISFTDADIVDYKTIDPLIDETESEEKTDEETAENESGEETVSKNNEQSSNNTQSSNRPSAKALSRKNIRYDDRISARLSVPKIGSRFPDLSGTTFYGERIRMSSYRGKVVLIDFWASWCGPCRRAMPHLKYLNRKYNQYGFEVVGISMDRSVEDLQEYLGSDHGYLPWPSFYFGPEESSKFGKEMGIVAYPTTFLIDESGTVVAINPRGAALEKQIREHLDI